MPGLLVLRFSVALRKSRPLGRSVRDRTSERLDRAAQVRGETGRPECQLDGWQRNRQRVAVPGRAAEQPPGRLPLSRGRAGQRHHPVERRTPGDPGPDPVHQPAQLTPPEDPPQPVLVGGRRDPWQVRHGVT